VPILDHTPDFSRRDEWLRNGMIVWLGSVRPDGRPHFVPVWYIWDGEILLVLSQPGTQKVRNLERDRRVAVALDNTRVGRDVVLLEGEATLMTVPSAEVSASGAVTAYLEKYADLLVEMEWSPDEYVADYSQAILIQPTRFIAW
jgi:PPOX class probable F420-dependent enzyme